MSEIRELKVENPLHEVIIETGYKLTGEGRYLAGVGDAVGMTVDTKKGVYYWGLEKGDVIEWLRNRFTWDFRKAVMFLKNRPRLTERDRFALLEGLRAITGPKSEDNTEDLVEKALPVAPGKREVQKNGKNEGDLLLESARQLIDLEVDGDMGIALGFVGVVCEIEAIGRELRSLDKDIEKLQKANSPQGFVKVRAVGLDEDIDKCILCYGKLGNSEAVYAGLDFGLEYGEENYRLAPLTGYYCKSCVNDLEERDIVGEVDRLCRNCAELDRVKFLLMDRAKVLYLSLWALPGRKICDADLVEFAGEWGQGPIIDMKSWLDGYKPARVEAAIKRGLVGEGQEAEAFYKAVAMSQGVSSNYVRERVQGLMRAGFIDAWVDVNEDGSGLVSYLKGAAA